MDRSVVGWLVEGLTAQNPPHASDPETPRHAVEKGIARTGRLVHVCEIF